MISYEEAKSLVSGSRRYQHYLIVSSLMRKLAALLGADPELWTLVGLLHDMDYEETAGDKRNHGVKAAEHLTGKLPVDALNAIRRHDFRTSLKPETELDHSLILCDAMSKAFEYKQPEAPDMLQSFMESLEAVAVDHPWFKRIVEDSPILNRVSLLTLLESN